MKISQKYIYQALFFIPVVIILLIIAGIFFYIPTPTEWKSVPFGHVYWSLPLLCLQIPPFFVFLMSILLIIRQSPKLKSKNINEIPVKNPVKKILLWYIYIPKHHFIPFLAYLMLLFWSIGWGLYICALWSNYSGDSSIAEILGYSAISSLNLFLLDLNGNVLDNIGQGDNMQSLNFIFLKGGITITSIFCVFCSFAFLIKLFVHRFYAYTHIFKVKVTATHNNHIYIFFGINEKSVTLSNSIKNSLDGDPRNLCVFVDLVVNDDREIEGIQNIINKINPSSSQLSQIQLDDSTIYLCTESRLQDFQTDDNLWETIGLAEIDKLIMDLAKNVPQHINDTNRKPETLKDMENRLHFFFLNDNRDENMVNTRILASCLEKDPRLSQISKTIHCYARKDSVACLIEDSYSCPQKKLEVKVIDDAFLSIETLKKDKDSNPVNFVEIDTTQNYGAVKSKFTSLIVGFGETGRDALRFIYEFSAFVDSESINPKRSPFKAYVVDENMENLKGHFMFNNPYVNSEINIAHNNSELVEFCDFNHKSHKFYALLKEIATSLNYVVVAIGDDEANITLAINIIKMVRRYRNNLNHFRIFVRSYENSSFSHLVNIAHRYNLTLKNESNGNNVIKVFGSKADIYTYQMIVSDNLLKEAIEYYNVYKEAYNKTVVGQYYKEEGWWKRREDALATLMQNKIDDLRRKEFQDRENALHKITKYIILESVLLSNIKHREKNRHLLILDFINAFFQKDKNTKEYRVINKFDISYPGIENLYDFARQLINNLTITEHLRWNASHEMLGYSYFEGCKKSTIKMTHSCLVPWNSLPPIVIATFGNPEENADNSKLERMYDYLVVETSFNQFKSYLELQTQKNEETLADR